MTLTEYVEENLVQNGVALNAAVQALILLFDVDQTKRSFLAFGVVHGQNAQTTIANCYHRIETDNIGSIITDPDDLCRQKKKRRHRSPAASMSKREVHQLFSPPRRRARL